MDESRCIPNQNNFRLFLDNMDLSSSKNQKEQIHIFDSLHNSQNREPLCNILYFNNSESMNLDALIRKIEDYLGKQNHYVNNSIVKSILALYCIHPKKDKDSIKCLNNILDEITSSTLHQFSLMRMPDGGFSPFKFGSYAIGPIDMNLIKELTSLHSPDFYDLHSDKMKGTLCLSSKPHIIQVIPWVEVFDEESIQDSMIQDYIWLYFEELAFFQYEVMWNKFMIEQAPIVMNGGQLMESDIFRRFNFFDCSIFTDICPKEDKCWGWVIPYQKGTHISLGHLDSINQTAIDKLNAEFQETYQELAGQEVIQSFFTFCTNAKIAQLYNRKNEAYINYWIAIELLLGESENTSEVISKRTALLTYLLVDAEISQQYKKIKKLYDKRSRYVHSGFEVDNNSVKEIESICSIVSRSLLRVNKRRIILVGEEHEKWKSLIGYLFETVEFDRKILDDDLQEIGVIS